MIQQLIDAFAPRSRAGTVQTLGHPSAGVVGWLGTASENTSGVSVTPDVALTYAAVWCATRIISETLACLPCVLYRRTSDDGRERATDDYRYALMHDEPHPALSPVTFFETITAHAVLCGNGYAKLVTNQLGQVVRFEPRLPETVTPAATGDSVAYTVTDPREQLDATEMLHVFGLGSDGIKGYSVVSYAAQSIGGGIAGDRRASSQHGNNAMPGGLLMIPTRLNKDARDSLRRDWDEMHGGPAKAGRVGILHGGMDFKPLSMSNDDAQFLESRQFTVREIARWFRLPPHMLADIADSSVRANIEQQAIEFVIYSMKPWIVRWEQALNRKLLSRDERRTMYFEFLLESLLRGDIESRYRAYSTARQWGWMSVNEIRRSENLNSIENGDLYLQPANMVPAGYIPRQQQDAMQANLAASLSEIMQQAQQLRQDIESGQATAVEAMNQSAVQTAEALKSLRDDRELIRQDIASIGKTQVPGHDPREELAAQWLDLFRAQLLACVRIEKAEVIKAARRQDTRGESFLAWCDTFYSKHHKEIDDRTGVAYVGWERCTGKERHTLWDWCDTSHRQLLAACDGDPATFVARVQSVLDTFDQRAKDFEL